MVVQPPAAGRRARIVAFVAGGTLAAAMLLFAAAGLRRSAPPTFAPTSIVQRADGRLVGPTQYTIDATDAGRWRYFSFAEGSVIERPGPRDWDLAFRRFQVIVNGGPGFAGDGGVADLGEIDFDALALLPADDYVVNTVRSDTVNTTFRRWYDYSYLSHLLTPSRRVFAIRTADGRFAKLQFVGYYCPGATPGCVTFRYAYQGAGGRRVQTTNEIAGEPRLPGDQ